MADKTPTPRTDAAIHWAGRDPRLFDEVVDADFAREQERMLKDTETILESILKCHHPCSLCKDITNALLSKLREGGK